jgi:hypothetical protein
LNSSVMMFHRMHECRKPDIESYPAGACEQ